MVFSRKKEFSSQYEMKCVQCGFAHIWKSSLELGYGKNIVTLRTFHAYLTSGMQKVQFTRFSAATGIGKIHNSTYKKYLNELNERVVLENKSSCESALTEELNKIPEVIA